MSRVRFAAAMSAMSCWSSVGIGGRPRRRDFQRQNSRKVSRCHRTNLSGRTIVSGVVGRCVRVSTRAGSAGTDSRPRAASETGTSGPTVVAGHRRERTPCGSREAFVLCGPKGETARVRQSRDTWGAAFGRIYFLRSTAARRRRTPRNEAIGEQL